VNLTTEFGMQFGGIAGVSLVFLFTKWVSRLRGVVGRIALSQILQKNERGPKKAGAAKIKSDDDKGDGKVNPLDCETYRKLDYE